MQLKFSRTSCWKILDIDDNLLLETLMQIEKQPLQTQSKNQFIQHENVMSNHLSTLITAP
jgi:hypothetical protein